MISAQDKERLQRCAKDDAAYDELLAFLAERQLVKPITVEDQRIYENLIHSSQDSLSLVNRQYIYEIVNNSYLRRTGLSRAEIEGHHVADVMGTAAFESIIKPQLDRCFSGETIRYAEWFDYASVGRQYVHVMYQPYHDDTGNIVGAVVNTRDITHVKDYEKRDLELALERERVEMLQHFIQDASHDLRTPITIMKSSLELLEINGTVEQKVRIVGILSQLGFLHGMLEKLFEMSEMDVKEKFDNSVLDINKMLTDLANDFSLVVQSKQQRLILELAPGTLAIRADAQYLPRVFLNLMSNATNYTPSQGQIVIRSREQEEQIIVEIEDTGVGISTDELPHIFERFYRVDKTRSGEGGHSGLGLSIVKKIIDKHGGTIEVESEPAKGSVFRTCFPKGITPIV